MFALLLSSVNGGCKDENHSRGLVKWKLQVNNWVEVIPLNA